MGQNHHQTRIGEGIEGNGDFGSGFAFLCFRINPYGLTVENTPQTVWRSGMTYSDGSAARSFGT